MWDPTIRAPGRSGFAWFADQACGAVELRQMVALIVNSDETAGAIRSHERFGFNHAGIFKKVGHKFGRDVDTHLTQLNLATS